MRKCIALLSAWVFTLFMVGCDKGSASSTATVVGPDGKAPPVIGKPGAPNPGGPALPIKGSE